MFDWLTSDAKAVIALIALAQPWVISLVKRYWRPGTIDVYPTGTVEVGFSAFGATLGVQGTIRAVDRELFVSSMDLETVRLSDSSRHKLEWGAFRPPAALLNPSKDPIEVPAGFMLQPAAPRRFNIMFFDTELQAVIKEALNPFERTWYDKIRDDNVAPDDGKAYYNGKFKDQPIVLTTYTVIDRAVYWQKGDYSLTLRIHTARPDRMFETKLHFSLSENDAESLRRNSLNIMRAAANIDDYFYFASAPYK